jgi:hypothetical protein
MPPPGSPARGYSVVGELALSYYAESHANGWRSFKIVTNAGSRGGTEVYFYDGWQIIAI